MSKKYKILAFTSFLAPLLASPVLAETENKVLEAIADFGGVSTSDWWYVPFSIVLLTAIFAGIIFKFFNVLGGETGGLIYGGGTGEGTEKSIALIVAGAIAFITIANTGMAAAVAGMSIFFGIVMVIGVFIFFIAIGGYRSAAALGTASKERLTAKKGVLEQKREVINAKNQLAAVRNQVNIGNQHGLNQYNATAGAEEQTLGQLGREEQAAEHTTPTQAQAFAQQQLPLVERLGQLNRYDENGLRQQIQESTRIAEELAQELAQTPQNNLRRRRDVTKAKEDILKKRQEQLKLLKMLTGYGHELLLAQEDLVRAVKDRRSASMQYGAAGARKAGGVLTEPARRIRRVIKEGMDTLRGRKLVLEYEIAEDAAAGRDLADAGRAQGPPGVNVDTSLGMPTPSIRR